MARKQNMLRQAERYSQYLLWEATGGAMGKEPVRAKAAKEGEFALDFQTKRALLDSMIKLIGIKSKVEPEDQEEDGIETYRELLRDTTGSNTNGSRGDPAPSEAGSSPAPAIHGQPNGAGTHDFLE
ncbi:MAG: hypothetical protein WBG19_09710 [Thermoplasmata archaeon]